MAIENRPTEDGAVSSPSTTYSSRGVFNNDGETTTESGSSSSSTTADTLTPSTGTGTGGNVNDTEITLNAGAGIDGGGSFTTNQATTDVITFSLPNTFVPGTGQSAGMSIGTADNPVQSITVDAQGRVSSVTVQTAIPQPTPFNDNFRSSSDAPAQQAASEEDRMETITLQVADGYTIDMVDTTPGGILEAEDVGAPSGLGTNMVTIPVTIPAVMNSDDMVGTGTVSTSSMITETSSGRTMTETATPLSTTTFIPFYNMIFDTQQTSLTLAQLTASTGALTNGTSVSFTYNTGGPRRQYGYLALERVSGRTYQFDAGFFDISTDPTGMTAEMFGRTYDFYEFPTQANLSFSIRW